MLTLLAARLSYFSQSIFFHTSLIALPFKKKKKKRDDDVHYSFCYYECKYKRVSMCICLYMYMCIYRFFFLLTMSSNVLSSMSGSILLCARAAKK